MASIFSLYGNIFVENEDANKKIEETTSKGKNSSKTLAQSLGETAKTVGKIGTAVVGGATAVVTTLGAMASKTAETADTFDKASFRTGLQVEELQRLNYACGQSGIELSTLEKSAKKLNERLGEVSEGNKTSVEMFEKLGVAVRNSDGSMKSSTDVYNDVLSKLADMGDTAEATAIGTDLFGKAFTDMKPLLAGGSEGIEELKNRADELGIVLSEDSVTAGVVFGDTLADIKMSLGGVFNSIMGSLIPVIQQVLDLVLANMPIIQGMLSTLAPVLVGLLQTILPIFVDFVNTILPILLDLITQLMPFITDIIQTLLPVFAELIAILLPPLVQIISALLPPLLEILDALMPLLRPILDLLTWAINTILMPIINVLSNIINIIGKGLTGAIQVLTPVVKGVLSVFQDVFGSIYNVVKVPINFVIDGINTFIKALNKVKVPDWVPGVGGKGINLPLISKLRVGMDYVPYDEMPSLLHKGEMVLTKEEAREYRQNKNIVVQSNNLTKEDITDAFKEAIKSFKGKVVLDEREVGKFVIDTMEGAIYG